MNELHAALLTCEESAPGPDGLTYGVYKKAWDIFGPLISKSWDYSNRIGELSTSQKDSTITLLEKKGKDRAIIENLRPISLSNCDIKICTKTIALRTNKVLSSIRSKTQTGYVRGRQVNDNSRLLEEVIENAKRIKEESYLITLDAQKAFDSVDHTYLQDILRKYGFPPEYIAWVKVIYSNLRSNVLVNGFKSEIIHIGRSVKQGDALSCALFVITIDPLLRAIENDTRFSEYSGIKLNINKTEILVMGKQDTSQYQFTYTNGDKTHTLTEKNAVKICGITFSNDKLLCYAENITKRIDKLERQLTIWRQRNLTLQGKILIVKTFGISQLIYAMQATTITNKDIKSIDNIIYKFIWNIKPSSNRVSGKIRREILQQNTLNGGLNAPNIRDIDISLKYKHLLRCTVNEHKVSELTRNILNLEQNDSILTAGDTTINSPYINRGMEMNKTMLQLINKDINELLDEEDGLINKNYFAYIYTTPLNNNNYTKQAHKNSIKILERNGIETYGTLLQEKIKGITSKCWLETAQMLKIFPKSWIMVMMKAKRSSYEMLNSLPTKMNIWKDVTKITTKDIRERIKEMGETNKPIEYIERRHHVDELTTHLNPFIELRQDTKEEKLRNVQYKILHNIYPTMYHLYKWKIKETANCSICNVTETTLHAIYECPVARQTYKYLESLLSEQAHIQVKLNWKDVLLGIQTNTPNKGAINSILIILKRNLILQREEKRIITMEEIEHIIKEQMKKEKYIATKSNTLNKYSKRWGMISRIGLVI